MYKAMVGITFCTKHGIIAVCFITIKITIILLIMDTSIKMLAYTSADHYRDNNNNSVHILLALVIFIVIY